MPPTVRQRQIATAGTLGVTIAATFGLTPNPGSLLVGFCNLRKGATQVAWPAGWTERATIDQQAPAAAGGNGSAEGMSIATRVAAGGEPTLITCSGGSFDRRMLQIYEVIAGAYVNALLAQATGPYPWAGITPPANQPALLLGIVHWFEATGRSTSPVPYVFEQEQAANTGSDSDFTSGWSRAIPLADGNPYTASTPLAAVGSAFGTAGVVAITAAGGEALRFGGEPGGGFW